MKKRAKLGTLFFGLMMAAGIGMGATITFSVLRAFRPIKRVYSPTYTPNGISTAVCETDALNALSDSLQQIKTLHTLSINPLPTLQQVSDRVGEDIAAQLLPAPFPALSNRALDNYIPVIMYHDITPTKDVDYDVTPAELTKHFETIKAEGMNPISMDQLVQFLRTGVSLPNRPVLLSFDDNYRGQYLHAFPLLKKYNFPAIWSVHTAFVGKTEGKPKASWEELKEMVETGLITVASHTVSHRNLGDLAPEQIDRELRESKQTLEQKLGRTIRYFTYPEGTFTESVKDNVIAAGYQGALTMSLDPTYETSATESQDLLSIRRYGQSRFADIIQEFSRRSPSSNVASLVPVKNGFAPTTFSAPIEKHLVTIDNLPLTLVFGGQPVTVHADRRAQVEEIQQKANAIAAVDGAFFSLEFLDSNQMIGPILSQNSSKAGVFNPGKKGENPLLKDRPLVLISDQEVRFVPYNPDRHSTLEGVKSELPGVTDAFVGAGWLVKKGKPMDAKSFGKLYGFDAHRDRAFWGIDRAGRPVIGVTMEMIDSVGLGKILAKAGLYDVVMLDSGASAALSYRGKSVMAYEPRPVPHVVALRSPKPVPVASQESNLNDRCVSALP